MKQDNLKLVSIIGCIIFLCIPLVFMPRHEVMTFTRYLLYCISMLAYVAIFYLNYLWLIKKYLFDKKWFYYFSLNFIIITVLAIVLQFWQEYIFTIIDPHQITGKPFRIPSTAMKINFAIRDEFMMILVAGLAVAIKMTVEWNNAEKERAKIEAEASEAELKNLKNQLNPHFLFNTLNNIYALTITDSEKAQGAILGLSKILRYVLYDNSQNLVPIDKEIAFTKSYIDLMSLRLQKNVSLKVELPDENYLKDNNILIAPLLFMTLIENAFKHGVSQNEKSFIDIKISANNRIINCCVKNSYFPKGGNDKSGSGIGIENLKRRLLLQYPSKHTYTTNVKDGIYTAEIELK